MKVRDIPKSGRDGSVVHCRRGRTQYVRRHVIPKNLKTAAQRRVWDIMEVVGKGWGGWLSQPERDAWDTAAEQLRSRPCLGQSGPLTGEVLFEKLNFPRTLIGREWLRLPSEPVVFGPSPVGELTIRREQGELRLDLAVSGPVSDDIMVFATPPCRPTWRKCRKARYLGLLPTPVNGVSDITALYLERFGEPEPGQRIFVRTVRQRDGWESEPVDTTNLVPAKALLPNRQRPISSFIIPTSSFTVSPCPWDVQAVRTVCARWTNPGRGLSEGEHRTSNLEPRTLNQDARGLRSSRFEVRSSRFKVRPPSLRRQWGVCQLGEAARDGPPARALGTPLGVASGQPP
jgi:hypothetical protein